MVVSGCCSPMSCALWTTKDDDRPQGREVDALSTCKEPPMIQTEFLNPLRLYEATTSSSSIMLSRTSYTARGAWNALTSRLIR